MIRLRQLEAFRAVMIAGGVTQAGDLLRISQPAVSRLITNLEQTLKFPLFERRQGRLHPTPEADFLFGEVNRAIASLDHISKISDDIRNRKTGHLRIACLPGFATSLLPRVIAEFLEGRPDVTVSFQPRSSARVREWIAAQQYDIGIADEFEGHSAITCDSISVRSVCILPEDHPLTEKSVITPTDLSGESVITPNRDHGFYRTLEEAFDNAGAKFTGRVETRQFATACIMVGQGLGVAIVSSIDAQEYAEKGLAIRRFAPAIPFNLDLLYPVYHPRSLLLRDFVDRFKASLQPFLHEAAPETS